MAGRRVLDRKTLAVLLFLYPPCKISSSLPVDSVKTKGCRYRTEARGSARIGAGVVQAVLQANRAGNAWDTESPLPLPDLGGRPVRSPVLDFAAPLSPLHPAEPNHEADEDRV
jgi:hypothetical protein